MAAVNKKKIKVQEKNIWKKGKGKRKNVIKNGFLLWIKKNNLEGKD